MLDDNVTPAKEESIAFVDKPGQSSGSLKHTFKYVYYPYHRWTINNMNGKSHNDEVKEHYFLNLERISSAKVFNFGYPIFFLFRIIGL